MTFDRTGIILYTKEYLKCVDFYQNIIGLSKMFETEYLTCFKFGEAYLMVELDSEQTDELNKTERIKNCK
ncbi:hypothetical protein [uncultured Tenacibaculum sp.]|uniref:hypothetical protein n=1 Tax=uncultured Tenacibaculum sp. TaxID=174713 RepID=UPI00262365B3|nr:hypothetical protein [uncultured Tenacibaculum sp.]